MSGVLWYMDTMLFSCYGQWVVLFHVENSFAVGVRKPKAATTCTNWMIQFFKKDLLVYTEQWAVILIYMDCFIRGKSLVVKNAYGVCQLKLFRPFSLSWFPAQWSTESVVLRVKILSVYLEFVLFCYQLFTSIPSFNIKCTIGKVWNMNKKTSNVFYIILYCKVGIYEQ